MKDMSELEEFISIESCQQSNELFMKSVQSSLDIYRIKRGYFNLGYFNEIVFRNSVWIRTIFVLLNIEMTVPSSLPIIDICCVVTE